jgi:hypothetical protein
MPKHKWEKDGANTNNATTATAQSLTYINALRQRANGGATIANVTQSQVNLDFMIDERTLNCIKYDVDLFRFNKYGGGSYNGLKGNTAMEHLLLLRWITVFPLLQVSITANPKLNSKKTLVTK